MIKISSFYRSRSLWIYVFLVPWNVAKYVFGLLTEIHFNEDNIRLNNEFLSAYKCNRPCWNWIHHRHIVHLSYNSRKYFIELWWARFQEKYVQVINTWHLTKISDVKWFFALCFSRIIESTYLMNVIRALLDSRGSPRGLILMKIKRSYEMEKWVCSNEFDNSHPI